MQPRKQAINEKALLSWKCIDGVYIGQFDLKKPPQDFIHNKTYYRLFDSIVLDGISYGYYFKSVLKTNKLNDNKENNCSRNG